MGYSRNTPLTSLEKYATNGPRIMEKIDLYPIVINKTVVSSYFYLWLKFIFHELNYVGNKLARPVGPNLLFISSLINQICKSVATA